VTSATDHEHQGRDHRYHHGDLPNALRRSAADVIAEQGLGNFSLREVARRAGVSHTAPAHHFGDARGLLTALATEGFDALHDATSAAAATEDDPASRLVAIGQAYVTLASEKPGHCQVMFRTDVVDTDDDALRTAGLRAYAVLQDAVGDLIASEHLDADADVTAELCWASMQGLVVIQPKLELIDQLAGRRPVGTSERVRRLVQLTLDGVRHAARTT